MNLRWSILHFFIYIVQICWNLDTQCAPLQGFAMCRKIHQPAIVIDRRGAHCASFVYGMHRFSCQPALSIHFPFSILNFPLLHRLTQLHILGGIYLFIIDLHLKMQMRAGGVAGIAGKRDLLSLADYIADRHEQL